MHTPEYSLPCFSANGRGKARIDVSLFDALGEWMGYAMYYTMGGSPPPRTGASHATIAPYWPYDTKDGSVIFGIHNSREWSAFCSDVLERPELAEDPRFQTNKLRVEHRQVMDSAILTVFRGLTAAEVIQKLDRAGIANARINSVSQFIEHTQLATRNSWRQVDSPAGPVPALIPPVRMDGIDPVMGAIPALGQHSESILAEFGFDAATITQWKDQHVF
jgi:crotonobetainyl-CoA:carnitine CoA-transferase CaiB-like acyl-CoA transferase